MRRWFLSFNSSDRALAEGLKASIERKDAGSSVFFDATSLRAGGYWQPALAKGIDEADAFVLLVGENGLGPWQTLEFYEAHDKHVRSPEFPVVLMLLDGHAAPGLPFLRQLHWIVSADPTSEKDVARLIDASAGTAVRPGELWRYTSPYRGLSAMEEKDADYFFGRRHETVEVLMALAEAPDKLAVLLGNSGVGKSSVALAGVLAALKRQAWPEGADITPEWPHVFRESRRWCFLTLKPGTEPLKALVEAFLDTWRLGSTDPERIKQQTGWIELLRDGKAMLGDLLDASERRYKELDRAEPPAFLLYVDQGEELYVRADEGQRRRFSEVIAQGVADPRLYTLMSMRSDFLGELQKDEPLYTVHLQINVPPLREAELHEVVSRPPELLAARFETAGLVAIITRRTAEDSVKDVGALPLLSYTLDDMWTEMVKRDDGVLRLAAQSFELGGVLVDRAETFLATHPKFQDELRRIFTLKLAMVRESEEPTRRRALRSEFSDEEWRLVSELAYDPYRLLVTATSKGGETYAEVAQETIFRRWDRLRGWITAEREFLAWKTGLEAAYRSWEATEGRSKNDALLGGPAQVQAQGWLSSRAEDIPEADREFIALSRKAAQRRKLRGRALIGMLAFAIIAGLPALFVAGYMLFGEMRLLPMFWALSESPLTTQAEQSLKPRDTFRECVTCPEMVVVPAGSFVMGSPANEEERPQHDVTIRQPFALGKFEVTYENWQACVAHGGCSFFSGGALWADQKEPAVSMSWNGAKEYVAWLSKLTGKPYRLPSEAEWEYAARAGTQTAYSWGDKIGEGNANCWVCGSKWDRKLAPVGSFAPNAFGLHDMHGNVWEWVEDCDNHNYDGAPSDGSAWTVDMMRPQRSDCVYRVNRGGAYNNDSRLLRSANRSYHSPETTFNNMGFRIARTLSTGVGAVMVAPGEHH
jgi:formylglycine-generating enzyme required for sulfatase activity